MSALPPVTDINGCRINVRFVPGAEVRIIRSPRRRWRGGRGEYRGRATLVFEIDEQLELGRLFDRQIRRLGALKYLVHQPGDLAPETGEVDAIRHQATFRNRLPNAIRCRQPVLIRESQDARPMDV